MKLLIITDSKTTSLSSSFFELLISLVQKNCNVAILDKSESHNDDFFNEKQQVDFFCYELSRDNSYSSYLDDRHKTRLGSSYEFTALWVRLDPPVSNDLLRFIELYFVNVVMINSSQGMIDSSSKKFLLNYPELCPEMKLCTSINEIESFAKKYPIVIKPLNSFGGIGLCRLDNNVGYIEDKKTDAKEVKSLLSRSLKKGEKFLAVKFLKNITKGDKRVLVVNSTIVGVLNRVPAKGNWLANLTQGATSEEAKISKTDQKIADILSKDLQNKGVSVYGFDVLLDDDGADVLSEINTLNVGGFQQVEEYGFLGAVNKSASLVIDYLESK